MLWNQVQSGDLYSDDFAAITLKRWNLSEVVEVTKPRTSPCSDGFGEWENAAAKE